MPDPQVHQQILQRRGLAERLSIAPVGLDSSSAHPRARTSVEGTIRTSCPLRHGDIRDPESLRTRLHHNPALDLVPKNTSRCLVPIVCS